MEKAENTPGQAEAEAVPGDQVEAQGRQHPDGIGGKGLSGVPPFEKAALLGVVQRRIGHPAEKIEEPALQRGVSRLDGVLHQEPQDFRPAAGIGKGEARKDRLLLRGQTQGQSLQLGPAPVQRRSFSHPAPPRPFAGPVLRVATGMPVFGPWKAPRTPASVTGMKQAPGDVSPKFRDGLVSPSVM